MPIRCLLLLIALHLACLQPLLAAEPPATQLAKVYEPINALDISEYLVSEKYDGVRAIWNGEQLLTRQGHVIAAPAWFTKPLPKVWLDGELWRARGDFDALSGIVRSHVADDTEWRKVYYMVFDMPAAKLPFIERYANYTRLTEQLNAPHIQAVKQQVFHSNQALSAYLDRVVKQGGEGLMLHLASALHQPHRSDALLKLKPYFDDEAEVIAHLPGRGKYTGILGALRVKTPKGIEFSIGTGFSDAERANPPPIGSVVTYKYHGFTNRGIPRFASFLRVRDKVSRR